MLRNKKKIKSQKKKVEEALKVNWQMLILITL